jgi:4-diphosphocytidyl-2C-methyl-D-erythritol kinase
VCGSLARASFGMAESGLDTGLAVSVAIPSSAGFAGGSATTCISLSVLLAEARLG